MNTPFFYPSSKLSFRCVLQIDYHSIYGAGWEYLLEAWRNEATRTKNCQTNVGYEFRCQSNHHTRLFQRWRIFVSAHRFGYKGVSNTTGCKPNPCHREWRTFVNIWLWISQSDSIVLSYSSPNKRFFCVYLQICGVIFDSAPGDRRLLSLYRAVSSIYGQGKRFKCLISWCITLGLATRWVVEVSAIQILTFFSAYALSIVVTLINAIFFQPSNRIFSYESKAYLRRGRCWV